VRQVGFIYKTSLHIKNQRQAVMTIIPTARDIPLRNVKIKCHDGTSLSFNYDVSCQDHAASVMAVQTLHLM
jgi:hypothetical protein